MLKKTFKEMQMTKVAMWCRHEADNLIGIGDDIPWHIPSDSRFFADLLRPMLAALLGYPAFAVLAVPGSLSAFSGISSPNAS